MRKPLALFASTVLGAAALLSSASPVSAATSSRVDPTGDASPAALDITATSLTLDKTNIVVTVDFAAAVPALSDSTWTSGGRSLDVEMVFNGVSSNYGGVLTLRNSGARGIYVPPGAGDNVGASVNCAVTAGISGSRITLTSPSACYAYPGSIAYAATSRTTANSGDVAPNGGAVFNDAASEPGGYYLLGTDGGVFSFGDAQFHGSTGNIKLNQPVVGMSRSGNGYRFVASDGGVFAYNAAFYGSTGDIKLNKPVVGMAATKSGNGYWLVASDGGIFSFGDAQFHGSTGNIALNKPIVGMVPTASGDGYWLVASDGGVFAFGDAQFYGSTGAITLNSPITGIARSEDGFGYYMVAADGGVFAFGDAIFRGSAVGRVTGEASSILVDAGGYRIADSRGRVFEFGSVYDFNDLVGIDVVPNSPVKGIA